MGISAVEMRYKTGIGLKVAIGAFGLAKGNVDIRDRLRPILFSKSGVKICHRFDGLDNLDIARATTQVARNRFLDLISGWHGGSHSNRALADMIKPGDAIAALHGAVI